MTEKGFTKVLLLHSSLKLFNKGGLEKLKVRNVANACHISIQPIYYIFGSQQDLQEAVLELALKQLANTLDDLIKAGKFGVNKNIEFGKALAESPGLIIEINKGNQDILNRVVKVSEKYFVAAHGTTHPKKLKVNILLVSSFINNKRVSDLNFSNEALNKSLNNFFQHLDLE